MLCPACHAQNLSGAASCAACGAHLVSAQPASARPASAPQAERPQILRPAGPALRAPGSVVRHDDLTVAKRRPVAPAAVAPAPVAPAPVAPAAVAPAPVAPVPVSVVPPVPAPVVPAPVVPALVASEQPDVQARAASTSPAPKPARQAEPKQANAPAPPPKVATPTSSLASSQRVRRTAVGARKGPVEVQLPALWRQLLADFLDFGIAAAPAALAYFLIISGSAAVEELPKGGGPEQLVDLVASTPAAIIFALFVAVVVHVIHHVLVFPRFSTTLGGLLTNLRVRTRDTNKPLGMGRAGARGVGSALGVGLLCLGPIYAYWLDRYRRGFGDLGTKSVMLPRDQG